MRYQRPWHMVGSSEPISFSLPLPPFYLAWFLRYRYWLRNFSASWTFGHFLWPNVHGDRCVRRPASGLLLVFYSNHPYY